MSGHLNEVTLLGNLGRDPEIHSFQGGNKVANLRLATSEKWRDKNTGEDRERTEWHSVQVWGDGLIRVLEQYTRKGSRLLVRGKLQTRKWQDQSGNDRYSTEVVVSGFGGFVKLLGDPRQSGGPADPGPNASGGQTSTPPPIDDDIPF